MKGVEELYNPSYDLAKGAHPQITVTVSRSVNPFHSWVIDLVEGPPFSSAVERSTSTFAFPLTVAHKTMVYPLKAIFNCLWTRISSTTFIFDIGREW